MLRNRLDKHGRLEWLLRVFLFACLCLPAAGYAIELMSVSNSGAAGNGWSGSPHISSDGRYVAFRSNSTNLLPNPNGSQIYIRDRITGITSKASAALDGSWANSGVDVCGISGDGRYVAFSSSATNLVSGANSWTQIYLKDLQTGLVERVSVGTDGTQGNGAASDCAISLDGLHVAFISSASNLVPRQTLVDPEVFVRDRQYGTTEIVSLAWNETYAKSVTDGGLAISSAGNRVVFQAYENISGENYLPSATYMLFLRDRSNRVTARVDRTTTTGSSSSPSISSDGTYIAFDSDTASGFREVYVMDTATGNVTKMSVASDGSQANGSSYNPSISGDGRYVVFGSKARNLVAHDPGVADDLYVRDRLRNVTMKVVAGTAYGYVAEAYYPKISANGRYIVFTSMDNYLTGNSGPSQVYLVENPFLAAPAPAPSLAPTPNPTTQPGVPPVISARIVANKFLTCRLTGNGSALVSARILVDKQLNDGSPYRLWKSKLSNSRGEASFSLAPAKRGYYVQCRFDTAVSNLMWVRGRRK